MLGRSLTIENLIIKILVVVNYRLKENYVLFKIKIYIYTDHEGMCRRMVLNDIEAFLMPVASLQRRWDWVMRIRHPAKIYQQVHRIDIFLQALTIAKKGEALNTLAQLKFQ